MNMWIQLHDFTSHEKNGIDVYQAKAALSTFDWQAERSRQEKLTDSCDPGLGLVADDATILHICPVDAARCYVHYHYPKVKKLFGFIPITAQESHFIESCSLETAQSLIEFHFNNARDKILNTN